MLPLLSCSGGGNGYGKSRPAKAKRLSRKVPLCAILMQLLSFPDLNIGSRDTVTLQQNGPSIPSCCRNNTPLAFPLPKRCYLEYFMVLSYYICKDKSIGIHNLKMTFSFLQISIVFPTIFVYNVYRDFSIVIRVSIYHHKGVGEHGFCRTASFHSP